MRYACYSPSDSTSSFLAAISAASDPDLSNFLSLFPRVHNTCSPDVRLMFGKMRS